MELLEETSLDAVNAFRDPETITCTFIGNGGAKQLRIDHALSSAPLAHGRGGELGSV